MTSDRKRGLAGIILIFLFIIGDIITGVASTPQPPVCGTLNHRCGTGTCTLNNGSCLIDSVQTFNPPLPRLPKYIEARFNNTIPQIVTQNVKMDLPITSLTFQAEPSNTWTMFPAAVTELYGQSQQRLFWASYNDTNNITGILTSMTADFCVTVVTGAPFGGQLRVQYSTNQVTWNNFGDASFQIDITNPGFFCVEELNGASTFPLLAGNFYFRVIGQNGAGVDNPAFGTIQLSLRVTKTVPIPVVCYATVRKLVTITSISIAALCQTGGVTNPTQATAFFVWEVWV